MRSKTTTTTPPAAPITADLPLHTPPPRLSPPLIRRSTTPRARSAAPSTAELPPTTPEEVGAILGVTRDPLSRSAATGRGPKAFIDGRWVRYRPADVNAFIA